MEYIERKPNRLQNFDYSTGGIYFITICTKNKEKLLGEVVGGGAFDAPQICLSNFGKIVEKYIISTNRIKNLSVEKYVIMPNHLHLLLFVELPNGASKAPPPTNISEKTDQSSANAVIPHAVSTLKRFVNREIGENIFQRSYYDHIIRNDEDYQKIWAYIENNPVKWNEDRFYVE